MPISGMVEEGTMFEEARNIHMCVDLSRQHLEVAEETGMPIIMGVDKEETREDAFDECSLV